MYLFILIIYDTMNNSEKSFKKLLWLIAKPCFVHKHAGYASLIKEKKVKSEHS